MQSPFSIALRKLLACAVMVCMAPLTACSSMKPIHPAQPGRAVFGNVRVGDTVKVETADGRRVRLVVYRVDPDALVAADGTRYARPDILRLERKSFSPWKTGALVGGLVVAAFVAFGVAIASDDDFGKWS